MAAAVGRLLGRPVVADLQGSVVGEMEAHGQLGPAGPARAALQALERAVLRWPGHLLASSTRLAHDLVERWGVPAARVATLVDGVDPEVFRPGLAADDLRERLQLTGKRVVAYVGVLTPYQGVDDLLAAWPAVVRAVPEAHLLLMGYPREEHYRAEVTQRGLTASITVTGRMPYEALPRHLALADVGVSPKHATTEANGKLLNYMAVGLPAVAYDGPISRELLGEAGTYAPPRDVPGLAAALAGLLADGPERKRRGELLRERVVARFGWPALGRQLLEVYRQAILARGGRPA